MREGINPKTSELAEVLRVVLSALSETAVPFCILRNYEHLPDYTAHDVDILIALGRLKQARETVRRTASGCGWRLAAEKRGRVETSMYFYCDSSETVQYLTFDLVTDLRWGWMPTVNVSHIFETCRIHNGIRVASCGCDAAMRLAKALRRGMPIKTKARRKIRDGARSGPADFLRTFNGFVDPALASKILSLCQNGDFEQLASLSLRRRLCLSVFKNAHCKQFLQNSARLCGYTYDRAMRHRAPLGLCVAFLGPDGAGKTTLTRSLAQHEGILFWRGCRIYHHEFGILPRLRNVAKPLVSLWPKKRRRFEMQGQTDEPNGPLKSLVNLAYYSIDYAAGHLVLWRLRRAGRLVLFDRYFYDAYFQQGYRNTPRWLIDVFALFVPKPDVVIVLQANARDIHRRKPELSVRELERQLAVAGELQERLDGRVPVVAVRTNASHESSRREICTAVLHALACRNYDRDGRTVAHDAAPAMESSQ